MRRGAIILAMAVAASVTAGVGAYFFHMRQDPDEWLGRRLGLEGQALSEFAEAHHRYAAHCSDMCDRVERANRELARHVAAERQVTPEIIAAIERAEALRAECKQQMLAHFYEVSHMLEPAQAETYLQLVLPLITENDRMEPAHHAHP